MSEIPLACKEFVELVTAWLDGALPAPERARFEAHLAECPHCRHYLAQMRLTVRLVGHLAGPGMSPSERERLLDCFREWTSTA